MGVSSLPMSKVHTNTTSYTNEKKIFEEMGDFLHVLQPLDIPVFSMLDSAGQILSTQYPLVIPLLAVRVVRLSLISSWLEIWLSSFRRACHPKV